MKRSGPWPTLTASAGVGHHSVPGFRRGQDLARRRGLRPALRPQARLPRDRPPARHQHNNRMAKVLVLPGLRDVPAAAAGPPAVSRATPERNQGMPLGGEPPILVRRRPVRPGTTWCHAHRRDRLPCGNHPIRGATVCRMHGGAAPQVRRKAAEQLKVVRRRQSLTP